MHYVDLTLDSSALFKSNERQFHIISIQRRLADHAFSNARTWPEIQQAHQTWWQNYNQEHHYAHRERQDGRHSPVEVLRGVLGNTIPEEVLSRALYAMRFTRQIDRIREHTESRVPGYHAVIVLDPYGHGATDR